MGFLKSLFGKSDEPVDPIRVMQDNVQPAIVAILGDVVADEDHDRVHGRIELDDAMRIIQIANLMRNLEPVMPGPDAIESANKHLAPAAKLAPSAKFTAISFTFEGGALEFDLKYPD